MKSYSEAFFFGDGEVAEQVPEIASNLLLTKSVTDSTELNAIRRFEEKLIQSLQASDPTFLNSFQKAMQSGQHLIIEKKLHDATKQVGEALSKMPEIQNLSRQLKDDPKMLRETIEQIKRYRATGIRDQKLIDKALHVLIANSLEESSPPVQAQSEGEDETFFLFEIEIFIWLWIVLIVAIVAVLVVFVVLALETPIASALQTAQRGFQPNLLREQVVNSIAINLRGN